MQNVQRKREEEPRCSHCGFFFFIYKHYIKKHEAKCHGENISNSFYTCQSCEKVFRSKSAKFFPEKWKQKIKIGAVYYIISNEGNVGQPVSEEHICKVCIISQIN